MPCRLAAIFALLLLARPAAAALKTYELDGDQTMISPIPGLEVRPGAVKGTAVIDEPGDGAPTLVDLELRVVFTDALVSSTVSCGVPGTTFFVQNDQVLRPAPGQPGSGDTTSTIHWGTLTGWTTTGQLFCDSRCPGGCPDCMGCVLLVGFEGTGPPAPLASSSFDSDPWTFSSDGFAFESGSIEYVDLGGGSVRAGVGWRGKLSVPIPALPLAGIAALAAALTWIGARALGRP